MMQMHNRMYADRILSDLLGTYLGVYRLYIFSILQGEDTVVSGKMTTVFREMETLQQGEGQ